MQQSNTPLTPTNADISCSHLVLGTDRQTDRWTDHSTGLCLPYGRVGSHSNKLQSSRTEPALHHWPTRRRGCIWHQQHQQQATTPTMTSPMTSRRHVTTSSCADKSRQWCWCLTNVYQLQRRWRQLLHQHTTQWHILTQLNWHCTAQTAWSQFSWVTVIRTILYTNIWQTRQK